MMLGWLWRILVGSFRSCEHKWAVRDSGRIYSPSEDETPYKICIGVRKICQCEKCGKWTSFNL